MHVLGQQKSEMHQITPKWSWTLSSQKYSIYTKVVTPEAQIWVPFALRTAVFKIKGKKSKMYQMTPNWTSVFNSQKYSIHII